MDEIITCEFIGGAYDGRIEHLTPEGIMVRIKLGAMELPIMDDGDWDTGKKARYVLRKIDSTNYRYVFIKGKT